jgi:hypothetical protein
MRVEQTCIACPTQYDIFLADGRYLYFRARHSRWSLEMYSSKGSDDRGDDPIVFAADVFDTPEADNGFMDVDQVLALVDGFLALWREYSGG